ncbi:hypothetical protein COT97_04605 [Candidatus Falkowbacteria bacterium CG10_big_fil_rev_8_21_14_0_10_39_11]|uniref:Type II secretion system protein n=1 Tax=Candidatus Falkowbacteria bacterium CG10_big_fil_rev_8_21_14_0_10_39_11 TaxID=1974565 RepID=A0A2H0V3Y7_9BACT|nr:MAG: hypothetical protein COT97_04605 [Candidatus Falkowbacteria bacterium CG10_big_fil_rev_8_21_14_0_10_39_11]
MKKNNHNSGFTLIELILYIGILSVIMGAVATLLFTFMQLRAKNQVIGEVEGQGTAAIEYISQGIRNSQAITSPTIGTSGSSLILDVVDAGNDPTTFSLSGTTLQVQFGAGSAIDLNSSVVEVSGLTFYNYSRDNTPGLILVEFTLTHVNPEGTQEYEYQKTFTTAASLR